MREGKVRGERESEGEGEERKVKIESKLLLHRV